MIYYKLILEQSYLLEKHINDVFLSEYISQHPNDISVKGYVKAYHIGGYGYIIKDEYTAQFITDYIEIIEDLPSIYPVYFANLNTEMMEGESAVMIMNGKVMQDLPPAEIQVVGGTEQQLLDYVFSENYELSELPEWSTLIGQTVKKGKWCQKDGKPYICINPHTVQSDWMPDIAVSLWVTRWPDGMVGDWRQPLGAHDAYKIGMMVRHNGWVWRCDEGDAAGFNSWEPGVFGWTQVYELEPGEPGNNCDNIEPWDSNYPHWQYQPDMLRKREVDGVWKVYKGIDTGQMHNDPAGPHGYHGWEFQYDCN